MLLCHMSHVTQCSVFVRLLGSPLHGVCDLRLIAVSGPAPDAAACAALIECGVRSEHFLAVDVLAAAVLLDNVCSIAGLGPKLTDGAVADAFASLLKRAVACIKAAGTSHAHASTYTAGGTAGLAAHCFAAAVPLLVACVLSIADTVLQRVRSDSAVAGQQQQASAALLTVLLARSLVALTDATDAAAEAAGMTPAQLYAR
jgi:hypothetical protein